MSETIDIRVRETREGNALQETLRTAQELERLGQQSGRKYSDEVAREHPETVARIQELYRTAGKYEERGDMPQAAQSARRDAQSLEGDLVRLTRERAAVERSVTQEHRERDAIARGLEREEMRRASALTRLGRAGANLAESAAGASPFGGVTSALGAVGGPAGIAAAAAAAIGLSVISSFSDQRRQERIIGLEDATERAAQARRLQRLGGFDGSSGGAREVAEGAIDDRTRREADRARLEEEARVRWNHPRSWLDALSGASRNAITENENAIKRDQEAEESARKTQRDKFAEDGGLELQAAERRYEWDRRGAREIERKVEWTREYHRLLREGAQEWQAQEGAGLKTAESIRQENMAFGRLINARSGAGDIARVAALATGQFGHSHSSDHAIHHLTERITEHHQETMGRAGLRTLRVAPLTAAQQNADILAHYGS